MRKFGSAVGVVTLAIGPWLALLASVFHPSTAVLASADGFGWGRTPLAAALAPGTVDTPLGPFHVGECTCRDITVEADNQVTNSSVQTGDARMENFSLTYVTAGYAQRGDNQINVSQDANARSGDAIAGQILGIDGGGGCVHITVHAHNLVADTDVRSGDALATNKSFVFLDPTIQRGDVKVNVDQQANARSGTALAGQIIGVTGGGGPCGGVTVDATNDVEHVNVETGTAKTDNFSQITKCKTDGCFREILLLLRWKGGPVQVCASSGCRELTPHQFIQALKEQAKGTPIDTQLATPTPDPNNDGLVGGADIFGTPKPRKHEVDPSSTPPATADPTGAPDPSGPRDPWDTPSPGVS
jgi:hypothetical protein